MTDSELTHATKKESEPSLETRVMECRAEGLGRNATARLLNISTRQVDNVTRELGIDWGGDHVEVANRARAEQAKTKRLEIAEKFRRVADLELQAVLNGEFESPGIRKDRITIAAISTDKDLAIARHLGDDESADMAQAVEMMDRFIWATKSSVHDMPDHPEDH